MNARDCHQLLLLILREVKGANWLLFPLKSSENLWSPDDIKADDFRGDRNKNNPAFIVIFI